MRFIHVSDVHLGRRPDVSFPWGEAREQELWSTFAAVVSECRTQKTDLLLIAGDLFDHQPSLEELKRVDDIFKTAPDTQVVMVAGASDYLKEECAYEEYRWADHVHFLKSAAPSSVYLEKLDVTVHGLSYWSDQRPERILEKMVPDDEGEIQILLAYGGDERHLPFDQAVLDEAGFDYVALGMKHNPLVMVSRDISYPGSLEPLGKDEIGKHGYIAGEITGEERRYRFVPFAFREYMTLKVRVSSDISEQELKERLKAVMEKQGGHNIYLICLEGRHDPRHPYHTDQLLQLGNVVEIEDRTVPDYDIVALLDAHRDDVVGMYMEELLKKPSDKKLQRALYCGLEALLFQEEPE